MVRQSLRAVAGPILANEHRLSMPIWIGGNISVVMAQLFGLNLTSAASWTLLACVMKGFAASVVSPAPAPPTPLTVEQLQPHLAVCVAAANSLRDGFSRVFRCTDPR